MRLLVDIIGLIGWLISEHWRSVLGKVFLAIGFVGLVIVFPYILILYCFMLGMWLLNR